MVELVGIDVLVNGLVIAGIGLDDRKIVRGIGRKREVRALRRLSSGSSVSR